MMVFAVAFAAATFSVVMVVVAVAVVAASAIAALAAHHVYVSFYFLVGGFAVFQHLALEEQCLACKGMVQVYLHTVVSYLHDDAMEVVAVFVYKGDNGTREYVL